MKELRITAKGARISDTTTGLSRKASNPSTSMMDKVTNEEINPNICCIYSLIFEEDTLEGSGVNGCLVTVEHEIMKIVLRNVQLAVMEMNITVNLY